MKADKLELAAKLLQEAVDEGEIAGGNLLVMQHGREVLYAEAGFADVEAKQKITRDTIFHLYSMTKPITGAAIMLLMERGKIDLLDPVSKYIKGFDHPMVADAKGNRVATREITIKDCLSMTTGLPYGGDDTPSAMDVGVVFAEAEERLYSNDPMTTLEFVERLGRCRLLFDPGEGFQYGVGADILGAVIEQVSGMPFGAFLQKEFFTPLGMKDTGFCVRHELDRQRLAKVYTIQKDGMKLFEDNRLAILNRMDRVPAFESGGAGLVSTIDDYAKFATMLLREGLYQGGSLLEPATVRFFRSGKLFPKQQEMMNGWIGLSGYSYGNLMRVLYEPGMANLLGSKGEYGWDGWLGAYFMNDPENDLTFLFMTQKTDAGTFDVTRKLRNAVSLAI